MSFEDNSTRSVVMQVYNGLTAKAKKVGFNVVIQLSEWKVATQNQINPVITIIPRSIKIQKPLSPGVDVLQSDLTEFEIIYWALDYDTLDLCISFFRQYTSEIFYNWCEWDSIEYVSRFSPIEQEQDQKGTIALQTFRTHTDRVVYREAFDTTTAVVELFEGSAEAITYIDSDIQNGD